MPANLRIRSGIKNYTIIWTLVFHPLYYPPVPATYVYVKGNAQLKLWSATRVNPRTSVIYYILQWFTQSILYADDTTIFYSSDDMNTLYTTVNSELELLLQWYMANKLSLNASKTQYVLFSKDGRQTYDNIVIRINGNSINSTNTANFLGLTIDNKLTWEYHIRSCKKRISSGLYALNTAKQFVSEAHLRTLYFSLMHSHITYGILLWGNNIPKVPTSIGDIAEKGNPNYYSLTL